MIGTTTFADGQLSMYSNVNTTNFLAMKTSADGTGGTYLVFENAAGSVIGNIKQASSTTTAFNTSSDRRLKENISPTTAGLVTLMNIQVSDYNFISDPTHRMQGFIAQDLYNSYPEAVSVGGDDPNKNPWQVDYGRVTPLIIKAVQDLNFNLEAIAGTVAPPVGSASETFANAFFANIKTKIGAWLADAGNGISNILAGTITAKNELCINTTCVNETQLKTLLAGAGSTVLPGGGGTAAPTGSNTTPSSTNPAPVTSDIIPPVITLNGEANTTLNTGEAYTEQGATATDNIDTNVAVVISGNVDTTTAGTYTIHYNATDTAGNHATEVLRTVMVNPAPATPPPTEPAPAP